MAILSYKTCIFFEFFLSLLKEFSEKVSIFFRKSFDFFPKKFRFFFEKVSIFFRKSFDFFPKKFRFFSEKVSIFFRKSFDFSFYENRLFQRRAAPSRCLRKKMQTSCRRWHCVNRNDYYVLIVITAVRQSVAGCTG